MEQFQKVRLPALSPVAGRSLTRTPSPSGDQEGPGCSAAAAESWIRVLSVCSPLGLVRSGADIDPPLQDGGGSGASHPCVRYYEGQARGLVYCNWTFSSSSSLSASRCAVANIEAAKLAPGPASVGRKDGTVGRGSVFDSGISTSRPSGEQSSERSKVQRGCSSRRPDRPIAWRRASVSVLRLESRLACPNDDIR